MLQKPLMWPCGQKFIEDVQKAGRPLYVWTVNTADMMRWSIKKGVDGVITDDPNKFLKLLDAYDDSDEINITWLTMIDILRINFFVALFSVMFHYRYGFKADKGRGRGGIGSSMSTLRRHA